MSYRWDQARFGKYKILDRIKSGGAGDTFIARDLDKNIVRTIKLLRRDAHQKDDVFVRAFNNEIRILSNILRPNPNPKIVEYVEAGYDEWSKLPYLVLEYLSGNDLNELIKEKHNLTLQEALHVLRQLCEALEFIHTRDVVHLDLCPQNVRITSEGTVKLMDFGQARKLSDQGDLRTKEVVAHPQYAAPEILDGKFDVTSDIYSLGIVFYEILTREVPFKIDMLDILNDKDKTLNLVNYKIRGEIPEPVNQRNPAIPKRIGDITAKMITKNPKDRYGNIGEVIKEIDSLSLDDQTLKTKIYERLIPTQKEETFGPPPITAKTIFMYSLLTIAGIGGLVVVAYLGFQLGKLL
jgi:serine/threonine protein kinase